MKVLAQIAFAVFFGFAFAVGPEAVKAFAADDGLQDYLKCPMSSEIKNKEGAMGWWQRRTPEQQRIVLALPCEERFVPIVCIFLYDPNLVDCSNRGLAEYRANKACQTKGLDLLSQEMADCKQEFKKKLKQPFSATS
jgi:hypothetical protein